MSRIEIFQESFPTFESYWRSIILFGRNVASYKFALAKSLLEIMPTGKTNISLEELAIPFSRNLCEHLSLSPKQTTSNSSQFLDTCKAFNLGEINHTQLIDTTVAKGFNNVIDAFHVVNRKTLPIKFYVKDYNSSGNKKIILTDEIFRLQEIPFFNNLIQEAESRWNLVETAWELGVSSNLLKVSYDDQDEFFYISDKNYRKDVTSARAALNGYQKGKCFYCFDDINVDSGSINMCDVDHFFPYVLQSIIPNVNLDGVWNLVLSCARCNRGENGKFALVPKVEFLERLSRRNEFLISSHHPLKDTLIQQMGNTIEKRHNFLRKMDIFAINHLINRWDTIQIGEEVF